MDYAITIPDAINWGIGAARDAYNEGRPLDDPERIADDAGYVQFVMQNAALSYCNQYPDARPEGVPQPAVTQIPPGGLAVLEPAPAA